MSIVRNALHLFAPLTANCRDFQEQWDKARPGVPEPIAGRWQGEWVSSATGHQGRLLCAVVPVPSAQWRMYFRAEYSRFLRACYSTVFDVEREPDRWNFKGTSDIGRLAGGRYTYGGYATLDQLVCRYKSDHDHGEFRLARHPHE